MARTVYQANQGSLWSQPLPGEALDYLGCHTLGDITQDQGDITTFLCPDPARNGKFITVGTARAEPGPVTSSIETPLQATRDALMAAIENCAANIYVRKFNSIGRRDSFANGDVTVVLVNARATSRGVSNPLTRDSDNTDETLLTADLSAEQFLIVYGVTVTRQTTAMDQALNFVSFCNDVQCETETQTAMALCEVGFAGGAAALGVAADGATTEDAGGTWTAFSAAPFDVSEDISAGVCFDYSGGTRYLVARGETDADDPAEVAYRNGTTGNWTAVNVGSVDGQYITALYAIDAYNIWAGTDDGYIYRSDDAGATWDLIDAGVLTTDPILAIGASDRDNVWLGSNTDVILRTTNGSASSPTLAATTAPGGGDNILAIDVHSQYRAWVGTSGGDAYFTRDGGATWTAALTGMGSVADVQFASDGIVGYLIANNGGVGTVYRTINGGATWEALTTPTNGGLNDLHVCDAHYAYVVGAVQGGTGFIARVAPSTA